MQLELGAIEERFHTYRENPLFDKAFQLWLQSQGILESVNFKHPYWKPAIDRTLGLRENKVGSISDALFLVLMAMPGMFISNQRLIYSVWGHNAEDNGSAALKQAFYRLKTDLPKAAIIAGTLGGGRGIGITKFINLSEMATLRGRWKETGQGLIVP